MVLPTLNSYFELKRSNFNEEVLRKRHTTDYERSERWSSASKYFNKTNVNSMQHNSWTSDRSYNSSLSAFTRQQQNSAESQEDKKQRLKDRQVKLSQILTEEKSHLEEELKQLRLSGDNNANTVEGLKSRADTLRSAREDNRKKIAEEKLYEHWRVNNPELRQLESRQLIEHTVGEWQNQLHDKQEERRKLQEIDSEYVKYLDSERERAIEKDIELKRLKLNRELELKEILKTQMIELKQKEAESEILKREEYELMREKVELDSMERERQDNEKRYMVKEYGRQLLRQHKIKLRQRAKEIQEALEHDLDLLKRLAEAHDSEKRVKAKADADYMIKVLNEQLKVEKEREAQFELLYQDEAQREWDKRNAEWERERLAREKLMNQVLAERQKQIEDKIFILNEKKSESLVSREDLIKDMEMTQRLAYKEREKADRLKHETRLALDEQMTTRREVLDDESLEMQKELQQEQMEKEMHAKMVEQEKQRAVQSRFEPKSFARKKVAWD